ncbi:MAG TPA: NAD-dependent deacylase [candidate division Zixibacteria bacterium]|nr:NAD-dependent deacylase [candidate division Zixibacteria bacterium]
MKKRSKTAKNADLIRIGAHDRVFVLTGAGVSAESGLATFRDNGGLWHGHRVEEVATPEAWHSNAEMVWQFYSMRRRNAMAAQPNPAHLALARLEERLGDRFFLCTQNVDDLHERAGSRRVVHMHGELFRSRCELCDAAPFHDTGIYEREAEIVRCACGARIRPHIVWFGEVPLEMPRIMHELDRCTVLVVVGTSGVVQPAASFVHWAAARYLNGGPMVHTYYVGPEAPANSVVFSRTFLGKAGELLPHLLNVTR